MNIKGISHLSLRVTHLLCCMTMAPHGLPCLQVVDFRPTNTFIWPVPLLWVVFISTALYVLFQCYIQCTCGLYLYYLPVGRESNPLSCISFKKSSVIDKGCCSCFLTKHLNLYFRCTTYHLSSHYFRGRGGTPTHTPLLHDYYLFSRQVP